MPENKENMRSMKLIIVHLISGKIEMERERETERDRERERIRIEIIRKNERIYIEIEKRNTVLKKIHVTSPHHQPSNKIKVRLFQAKTKNKICFLDTQHLLMSLIIKNNRNKNVAGLNYFVGLFKQPVIYLFIN